MADDLARSVAVRHLDIEVKPDTDETAEAIAFVFRLRVQVAADASEAVGGRQRVAILHAPDARLRHPQRRAERASEVGQSVQLAVPCLSDPASDRHEIIAPDRPSPGS
ncbi:hypothetical protein ACFHYO_10035 [Paracoccus panacisoli]|uniref:Uncharacterized protein n=1 Tax=Paracoccus panacisoli TaxID=1510163 RepID=A0ABV6T698_9RHOB